jgi:uncharacterized protein (TIGR03435 family)
LKLVSDKVPVKMLVVASTRFGRELMAGDPMMSHPERFRDGWINLMLRLTAFLILVVASHLCLAQAKPQPASAAQAQTYLQGEKAPSPALKYEIASIKRDKAGDITKRVRFVETPDAIYAENITLRLLIRDTYEVSGYQIEGAPKWVGSEEFDVEAKMAQSAVNQLQKLSVSNRWLQRRLMLQRLLADRFSLQVHRETKQGPVYALVVAKNGPKFQESKANGPTAGPKEPRMAIGSGKLVFHDVPIAPLARLLSQQLERPVVDKTGLTGRYDFTLRWTLDEFQLSAFTRTKDGQHWGDNTASSEPGGPSIFTALKEQLGLLLKAEKGSVEILVIDHIEQPSAN